MSSPPPNESTHHTFHLPPVISVPTTPLGAVQTMISLLSPPASAQGAPPPHATPASHAEISPDVPVHAYAPPPPPTPPTHIATDPADPALGSVSSHGARASTPPRGTARVTRSYPALPELSHPPPRPVPLPGADGRRLTAHYADSETAWHTRDDVDPVRSPITAYYVPAWPAADSSVGDSSLDQTREKTVALRLKSTIDSATQERDKAAQKAKWTGLALNIALGLQVLMGALTTALGAALSGKNFRHRSRYPSSAVRQRSWQSYLARMRGSNEPSTSLLRAKALNHFLREIHAFALDHGHEVGREWDDRVNGFRLGLENMLGNQPGSVTINTEAAGFHPGAEKAGLNGAGKYPTSATNAKLGFTTV
ncbi:hypothetical protein EDB84DRAFT_1622993 [Lactarius hengduanensis]|nr:hypothetical protein EDB84DRAFT_1622993 [Lactarius hengduanensis]